MYAIISCRCSIKERGDLVPRLGGTVNTFFADEGGCGRKTKFVYRQYRQSHRMKDLTEEIINRSRDIILWNTNYVKFF